MSLAIGTDDEGVGDGGGEFVAHGVTDVNHIKRTIELVLVEDGTDPTHVTTTGDHDGAADGEGDELGDLVGGDVELDGVVDLDGRVRVADGTAVGGDDVRDTLAAKSDPLDLAELVVGLLLSDAVDGEAALDVVKKTEVFTDLLKGDDVYIKL